MKAINPKPIPVKVLILEDEQFYNDLITRKIELLQQILNGSSQYKLIIQQFDNPSTFLQSIASGNNNLNTIVFIDYYLGYGITGLDIVYLLKEIDKNIKIILMSQSEKVIQNLDQSIWHTKNFVKMVKHEYTPEICYTIVENYIKNISC